MNLILMAAAVGLGLATICALAGRLWWMFDLFSHFRLHYVVLAGILGMVALATRAWPAAAVLVAVALVHALAIKDLWLAGAPAAAAGGMPLRVLCINVLAHNLTPDAVFRFVCASDADLVVLVDARRWRWRQVVSDLCRPYPHHAPQTWPEPPPVFVFSRFPIAVTDLESADSCPPARYLAVELAVGGQRLVVVGVHRLPPSPTRRGRRCPTEFDRIAELVLATDRPAIVAGDFNCTPWSPHFRDLVRATGLRNAADGQGYIATWPQWFWPAQIPIDHVLVKGSLAVIGLRRGPALGSDHYPIIADLSLPPTPGAPEPAASSRGRPRSPGRAGAPG